MHVWIPALSVIGLFFVGWHVGIFVHEMGHVCAALLCGWKTLQVKVGSGRAWLTFTIGDWQFQWAPYPRSGLARVFAQNVAYFRLKSVIIFLSGPAFTACLLVLLWEMLIGSTLLPSAPAWLRICLFLLLLVQGGMLFWCLVPGMVQVDGRMLPNDMLQVWSSITMKKDDVGSHFAGNVAAEALIYLQRGQNDRAHSIMERNALADVGIPPLSAKILWIVVLQAEGRTDEVDRVKKSLLDAASVEDGSRVTVLDGLACLPLYYGLGASLDEALGYIEQALHEAPDKITLKGTKAALLIELGRIEEGLKLIEEVAANSASENDRAIVLYYKALAASELGNRADGRSQLQQVIEKYPECVVRPHVERRFWNDPE